MTVKRMFILSVLFAGILLASSQMLVAFETGELDALLSEGLELFQQASNTEDAERARTLYQKALYRFEAVVNEGQGSNGKLLYNIGNTYYRLGHIGRAILFYRRAQLLIPADRNLKHNLRYVRTQRADLIPSRQDSAVFHTLFIWHFSLPMRAKLFLFIAAFWGACILTAHLLLQPDRRRRWKNIFFVFWGGIALMMAVSLVIDEVRLRTLKDGVIITEEVVARKGDGIAYQRSFVDPLHQGTEFRLLEERTGWYYIELEDGRKGWIPSFAGEMVLPIAQGGG
jgi:tetratricopeptide (TPR) repeat protein